jgi:CBS domain-containing protein
MFFTVRRWELPETRYAFRLFAYGRSSWHRLCVVDDARWLEGVDYRGAASITHAACTPRWFAVSEAALRTRIVLNRAAAVASLVDARAHAIDFIALEMHSHDGTARLLLGSVGDNVLRGCFDTRVGASRPRRTKKGKHAMNNPVTLCAETAADLMTPDPLSIRADATVREAVAFLTDKGFSAAPVIDNAGRPVGVLSRADIIVYDREKVEYLKPVPEYYEKGTLVTPTGEALEEGFQVEKADSVQVRDIMTPVVFSVTPETPARKVVENMLALKVHRLFVVSTDGVLSGVISTLDVLQHLRPEQPPTSAPVPAPRGQDKYPGWQARRAELLTK